MHKLFHTTFHETRACEDDVTIKFVSPPHFNARCRTLIRLREWKAI